MFHFTMESGVLLESFVFLLIPRWFDCLLTVNVTEFDLSNSVKNGIMYLEDPVYKASSCLLP